MSHAQPAPGPPDDQMLASFRRMWASPLSEQERYLKLYGDIVRLQAGPYSGHMLFHPEHVRHVLIDNASNYGKDTNSMRRGRSYLGVGLLTSEGDDWARQRRLTQPSFTRSATTELPGQISAATRERLAAWSATDGNVDIHDEMVQLTLSSIGHALFGKDFLGKRAHAFHRAFLVALREAPRADLVEWGNKRRGSNADARGDAYIKRYAEFERATALLDESLLPLIRERREGSKADDLLGRLMAARDTDGSGYDDHEILGQLKTLAVAGHETTASMLSFALYAMATNPDVWDKASAEAREVVRGDDVDRRALAGLTYTEMVLRETLRLYPPIWQMERRALGDDVVGGYRIPKDTTVMLSQWVTQRRADFWPEPLEFRPERFAPGAQAPVRLAYFPFGGGTRTCIGAHMAIEEGKIILALICRRFRPVATSETTFELQSQITLRPKGPLRLRMEPVR